MRPLWLLLVATSSLSACAGVKADPPALPPPPPPIAPPPAPPPPLRTDALERATFNQLAVRMNLPVFWVADSNGNRAVDADEVTSLLFYPSSPEWVKDGRLSQPFELAYASMLSSLHAPVPDDGPAESARRRLVLEELDQSRPILVGSDLSQLPQSDRTAAREILAATAEIDALFAQQTGMAALASRVPANEPASQSLFRRNWGPKCLAAKTEKNPACSAIPGAPKPKVDVYPAELQDEPAWCEALEKRPDAKDLLSPFTVVMGKGDALYPVKYSEAYAQRMQAAASRLDAAASALGPDEKPFADYLRAAAKAFRDNDWESADEAWSRMNAQNSKFYLRIGPDETYWEPCSQKAGFHASFALINRASLAWQQKLVPLQQQMEADLAKLIGWPYRERKVSFHLPDFIDVIVNGGDSRSAIGATIGQSLPNWGKVANESRGRTVAMSNLYTDADSLRTRRQVAESLLGPESAKLLGSDATPGLLATILHEAAHNLGPAHEYKFKGKTDNLAFGGGLASMLEELKSQTAALYYLELLAKKGVISSELQRQSYVDSMSWSFSQIAQGMWTESGQRKPYSQLAAVQVGFLMEQGALRWNPDAAAANGADKGSFELDFAAFPAACTKLMQAIGRIKAMNDKAAAEAFVKKYVEGPGVPHSAIGERVLRFPKNSFVYAVKL